jgi:ribosome-associated protein
MKKPITSLLDLANSTSFSCKGQNILQVDIRDLSDFADYMILVTSTSSSHARSLSDELIVRAKNSGFPLIGIEGTKLADWILVDFGDLIVHILKENERKYYNLEKLWDPMLKIDSSS